VTPGPRARPANRLLRLLFRDGFRLGWEYHEAPAFQVDPALETPPPLVPGRDYRADLARWEREYDAAVQAAGRAVADSPLWYPAGPERRCDAVLVYGGTAVSWEALLATAGASLLGGGRRLTVLDLSERRAGHALRGLGAAAGFAVREDWIASGGTSIDLFQALDADGLVHLVLETAGHDDSAPRAERQQDRTMLRDVVGCLTEGPVTLPRLVEGLRAVAGMPAGEGSALGRSEYRALLLLYGRGQSERGDVVARANRLCVHARDLTAFALDRRSAPAPGRRRIDLRTIEVAAGEHLDHQLAGDLVVQAVVRRLRGQQLARGPEALFLLGADRLRTSTLASILDAAERHGLLVLLVFEHLRDAGRDVLGWGNSIAAFLQLQNREEAEAAAGHVGMEEHFKLCQSTRTTGQSAERASGRTTGTSTGHSNALTVGMSFARTITDSFTRSQGTSAQESFGTNASIAATEQLVEELVLKPERFQSLPHTALVMVDKLSDRRAVLLDCNPTVLESRRLALPPP
jgi:hypothetical protein